MASFFHVGYPSISASGVTLLTSQSDSTIVLSILTSNVYASGTDVTVSHKDSSSAIKNYLASTITVPADASLELISTKYILPSGQSLFISTNISGSISSSASYVVV